MTAIPTSRYAVFFSIAGVGCGADLATKRWIFDRLGMPGEEPTWWLWEDVVGFQTSLNQGALFGMGQGMVSLFAALSIAAAIAILWWLFFSRAARDLVLTIALACVMGGILGNLWDRLGLPGLKWSTTVYAGAADGTTYVLHRAGEPIYAVRDWILVYIGNWPWPTFNVADSLLVCGAGLLVWHAFWTKPEEKVRGPGAETEGPATA